MKFGEHRNKSKRITWIPDPPRRSIVIDMGLIDNLILLSLPIFSCPSIACR